MNAKRRRSKEEIRQAKEEEQNRARQLDAQMELQEEMQRQMEKQRQQLSKLWMENKSLKQVKDEFIPSLIGNGFLKFNQQNNGIDMVESWQEHQNII